MKRKALIVGQDSLRADKEDAGNGRPRVRPGRLQGGSETQLRNRDVEGQDSPTQRICRAEAFLSVTAIPRHDEATMRLKPAVRDEHAKITARRRQSLVRRQSLA